MSTASSTCVAYPSQFDNGKSKTLFNLLKKRLSLASNRTDSTRQSVTSLNDKQHRFLSNSLSRPWISRALDPSKLPDSACLPVLTPTRLMKSVFASCTGPDYGFTMVPTWKDRLNQQPSGNWKRLSHAKEGIVVSTDLKNWDSRENKKAFGKSISLYERDPLLCKQSGDPIADCFFVRARHDSAFIAVADGVNWGEASMRASRAALMAVFSHLENEFFPLYQAPRAIRNTRDAAIALFQSFGLAHENILRYTSGLTTLCAGCILPLDCSNASCSSSTDSDNSTSSTTSCSRSSNSESRRDFVLVLASVGDCQAFVLSRHSGIREVTGWVPVSEEDQQRPDRDFREVGGALGPVYRETQKPELKNLICAVTPVSLGDVVILASDGLADNFDPVITGLAVPETNCDLAFVDEEDEANDKDSNNNSSIARAYSAQNQHFARPSLSLWPKPPPTPDALLMQEEQMPEHEDGLSARSLNFADRLEMSWPERRAYASKEMERLWHELECLKGSKFSAKDYCLGLLDRVQAVTEAKRALMQDTQFARIRLLAKAGKMPETAPPMDQSNPLSRLETASLESQRAWIKESLGKVAGKLDHATAVVYEVGVYHGNEDEDYTANML